jgi:hypothetical protein
LEERLHGPDREKILGLLKAEMDKQESSTDAE